MTSISQNNSKTSTSSVDPLEKSAQWTNNVEQVRCAWMEMMGMGKDDIAYHLANDPPTDLDEELTQYNAICSIQENFGN